MERHQIQVREFRTSMKESSKPHILGKEEGVARHEVELSELRKKWREVFPNEIEKDATDLFFIETFNSGLKKLTESLKLHDISPVAPEQIHLLKAADYEEHTLGRGGDAGTLPREDAIL